MLSAVVFSVILAAAAALSPPVDLSTCADVRCEPGQKCEMQFVVCVRAPCFPQPVCVRDKPGECPKYRFTPHGACDSKCWSDDDCPGDKKCCTVGCGKHCEDPLPETCATVTCPVGSVCREAPNENGDIQARCVALGGPKPGDCPISDTPDNGFGKCASDCSLDLDCEGDQKCCRNSCGAFTCQDPRLSCDTMDCPPYHTCVMKTECNKGSCIQKPICEPAKCPVYPVYPKWIIPRCGLGDFCSVNDPGTCPPGTLCCPTPCGPRCVMPRSPRLERP